MCHSKPFIFLILQSYNVLYKDYSCNFNFLTFYVITRRNAFVLLFNSKC